MLNSISYGRLFNSIRILRLLGRILRLLFGREREYEITLHASAMFRKVSQPSALDADIDSPENGGSTYSEFTGNFLITGVAAAVLLPMHQQPDQNEPKDDPDPFVVGYATQPIETGEVILRLRAGLRRIHDANPFCRLCWRRFWVTSSFATTGCPPADDVTHRKSF
jgi:hypothetical protein